MMICGKRNTTGIEKGLHECGRQTDHQGQCMCSCGVNWIEDDIEMVGTR